MHETESGILRPWSHCQSVTSATGRENDDTQMNVTISRRGAATILHSVAYTLEEDDMKTGDIEAHY